MGKFDNILICTDLDGTLFRNDKSISQRNVDAIEYFKSEGGYFTFITGRMPYYVDDALRKVKINAPFGCINGGGLYDIRENRYIWNTPLDKSVVELVKYVVDNIEGMGVQYTCFDKVYFATENSCMQGFRKVTGVPDLTCSIDGPKETLAKIVFGDAREDQLLRIKEIIDLHPRKDEFDYIRSEKNLYEILPKGMSKGAVLPRLAEHLGLDISRTVAVGDYNNDISMLRAAGVGIAVANATPEAKAAADRITVSNEEDAIAEIIKDIENKVITF